MFGLFCLFTMAKKQMTDISLYNKEGHVRV